MKSRRNWQILVPEADKSRLVGEVFTNVASKYDLMNDLMSGGLHRLWKERRETIQAGDIAFRVLDHIQEDQQRLGRSSISPADDEGEDTKVIVCDINPDMLQVGRQRARARGLADSPSLVWLEGNAEELPLEDNSMDGYTVAFGIRNVTHIDKALKEAHRVLKRGGRFLCLELSHVESPTFRQLYDLYSFQVIPAMGEIVAGDRDSYQYLVESIRKFPEQRKFARMLEDAGFQKVHYENFVNGVVAIHSGFKL
eukprot:jgi/Mesen1/8658/ME000504S08100